MHCIVVWSIDLFLQFYLIHLLMSNLDQLHCKCTRCSVLCTDFTVESNMQQLLTCLSRILSRTDEVSFTVFLARTDLYHYVEWVDLLLQSRLFFLPSQHYGRVLQYLKRSMSHGSETWLLKKENMQNCGSENYSRWLLVWTCIIR